MDFQDSKLFDQISQFFTKIKLKLFQKFFLTPFARFLLNPSHPRLKGINSNFFFADNLSPHMMRVKFEAFSIQFMKL